MVRGDSIDGSLAAPFFIFMHHFREKAVYGECRQPAIELTGIISRALLQLPMLFS